MRSSPARARTIAALFVGGVVAWFATNATAQEQRCTELGAACACSEPMDSSEGGSAINDGHNFSDSPSATECTQYQPYFGTSGSHSMVSVSGTSWGSASYAVEQGSGFIWLKAKSAFAPGDRVVCYRYYKQVDDLYSSAGSNGGACPGQNWRNKIFQMTFDNLPVQVQEQSDSVCPALGAHGSIGISVPGGTADGNYYLSPRVDYNDCDEKPCRFEFCADGNLSTGAGIQFRLRVTSLENGVVGLATSPVANYGPPNLPDFWGGDLYHSGPVGRSRVGYFLQTLWQTDQNQWPGPAVEVEGGGSGSDAAPTRPEPPVLLD